MKKVVSLLSALVLSLTCATAVNAEDFYGSATQNGGVAATTGTVTSKDGTTVSVSVKTPSQAGGETAYVEGLLSSQGGDVETFFNSLKNGEDVKAAVSAEVGNLSDLSFVSLFDVSIDQTLAAGDSVDITLDVDGIKAGDKVVALHFYNNEDNIGLAAEVLPSKVDADGNVVLTMSSFSPVLIMKDTTAGTGTGAGTGSTTTSGTTTTPSTGVYSNVALWAGVLVVAVAAAGIVLYDRKKKAN